MLPKTVADPVGGTLLQLLASKYLTIFSHSADLLHILICKIGFEKIVLTRCGCNNSKVSASL